MVVTVLLCILSSLAFCFCARALILTLSAPKPVLSYARARRYSGTARRIARGYVAAALLVLMIVSAAGAVTSYIELFVKSSALGF